MISSNVLPVSQQLSSEYTANGKVLAAVSGGQLGDLIAALTVMNPKAGDVMSEIVIAATPKNGSLNKYSYLKDKMVDQLSSLMESVVDYTKNYINAEIQEIMTGVEEIRNRIETETVTGNIKVKALGMAGILDSDYLELMLDGIVGTGSDARAMSSGLTNKAWTSATKAEVIKCMMTSSEEFNEKLIQFMATYYPGESVKGLDLGSPNMIAKTPTEYFEKNHDLVAYLFLSGLYAGRHPNVVFEDLSSEEKLNIRKLINYFGNSVNQRLTRMGELNKLGRVIIKLDPEKDCIYVNKNAYQKWLGEGGTSESLIGYWLSTGKSESAFSDNIALENKERFERAFKANQNVAMSNAQLELNRAAEKYIINAVIDVIKRDVKDTAECDEMIKLANKFYKKMDVNGFESIDDYCRLMVCKTIGKDSDALEILNGITEFRKENPDASMDEAVLMAITDRLVEVVFGQIQVIDESIGFTKTVDL